MLFGGWGNRPSRFPAWRFLQLKEESTLGGRRVFDPAVRVAAGMDFAQLGDRDRRVDLRRVEPGVPEQLLDEADVGAIL
jgi:hypothetical protein